MPTLKDVFVPGINRTVRFRHRDDMQRRGAVRPFRAPMRGLPITTLPVDSTGNAAVSCPMDGNDTLGICGPAMCSHVNNIWTFGQGKPGWTEWQPNLSALESQYLRISGGDNGTDEPMLVGPGGIWMTGLAGDPTAIVVDSLDIEATNIPLMRFAIDQNYAVCMAWSVPDDFLRNFATGTSWLNADTPDPENGHYTPLADIDANGVYRLWTWGTWCWVAPAFVASVQPQCFVAFSPRQFNSQGYDSKGRHITAQAALWVECGGSTIAASVINAFPPPASPTPAPTPIPTPPTPAPTPVPAGATAEFYGQDLSTEGNWRGAYGGDGYQLPADTSGPNPVLPSYVALNITGATPFTWQAATADEHGIENAAGTAREATCWYSPTNMAIAVNILDGQAHQVALYALDWNNVTGSNPAVGPRSQRLDVLDSASGAVLDSRTLSDFAGTYLAWLVTGNVTIRVTNLNSGSNAAISGLFFGVGSPVPVPVPTPTPTPSPVPAGLTRAQAIAAVSTGIASGETYSGPGIANQCIVRAVAALEAAWPPGAE